VPPLASSLVSVADAIDADRRWMAEALREARLAAGRGEVPVGAAVVRDDRLLARAGNASVAMLDPTGHAEVLALRAAAAAAGNYRLLGATLYVTVEPCAMCMGAALQARVARLVYGCADPKAGAAGSLYDLGADPRLNHRIAATTGVEAEACRALVQEFFRARRASSG
jgi:tRNA(Arg) A34 adenosine deaminase TadA